MKPHLSASPLADAAGKTAPAGGEVPGRQAAPEGRAAEIVCLLQEGPLHVDDLAERLRVRPAELSALLLQLELSGRIRRLPGARYEATS